MRLSVLDQSTTASGRSPDASIRETMALARHVESLGYARYWLAEHHSSDSQAGTAPEVLMAAIAATTTRIRVGSAGVMLPHYSALKVAEQFRVLEAIAPGRIDMGLGRAPGSDGRTAMALNPNAAAAAEQFPAMVRDLLAWTRGEALPDGHPFRAVTAQPTGPTAPEPWILGSSAYGAQVAAFFGLPYCFAHFNHGRAWRGGGAGPVSGHPIAPVPPSRSLCPPWPCGRWRRTRRRRSSGSSRRADYGGWAGTAACSARCRAREEAASYAYSPGERARVDQVRQTANRRHRAGSGVDAAGCLGISWGGGDRCTHDPA